MLGLCKQQSAPGLGPRKRLAQLSSTVRFGETVTLEGKGIGSVETL